MRLASVRSGLVQVSSTGADIWIGVAREVAAARQDLESPGGRTSSSIDKVSEAGTGLTIRAQSTGGDIEIARAR